MEKIIYADNAATTPVSKNVYNAMIPHLTTYFGNPSSLHKIGRNAKTFMDEAREKIAVALGADKADEIIITGGGSEADNLAIKGVLNALESRGKTHMITTKVEHPAIIDTAEYMQKQGFTVTFLEVDEYGRITAEQVANAITEQTALVSVMAANNEIGTIMPIAEIGAVCREKGVLFHVDAVQAIGHMHVNVKEMNIDLMSISGHKIHTPKGIGALYVRKGVRVIPIIHGGGQEKGRRSGTENIAGIVGLAEAVTHATENLDKNMECVTELATRLKEGLSEIPYAMLTGHPEYRLPGTVSFAFECIEGESLLLMLDMKGICASTGSACSTGSLDPSHVLMSIGLPHEIAHGSLRLSLDESNTMEEVEYIIEQVKIAVDRLREMSPLWEDKVKENKI